MARLLDLAWRLLWPVGPGAFRLWLSALVVVHHLSSFGLGKFAVYVFFALSGYWLQMMWEGRYRHARRPYATYLVSRLWRLAPVMVIVSLVVIAIDLALGTPLATYRREALHIAFSSVFLLGYNWLTYQPVGPAWSLDIEWQFYLLVPVLAWALRQAPLVLLAGAVILSAVTGSMGQVPILPNYLAFFVTGMVAAQRRFVVPDRLWKGSALALPLILIAVTFSPWRGVLWGGATPGPLFAWNPVFNVAMAVTALPFALWTVSRRADSADRALGDLSYPVYLLHWGGALWFYQFTGTAPARALAALGVMCAVAVAGTALWWLVDRPCNAARVRWVARRERPGEPVQTAAAEVAAP